MKQRLPEVAAAWQARRLAVRPRLQLVGEADVTELDVPAERRGLDVEWVRQYLAPWVRNGIRGLPARLGVERKRPVPTIVPKSRERVERPS